MPGCPAQRSRHTSRPAAQAYARESYGVAYCSSPLFASHSLPAAAVLLPASASSPPRAEAQHTHLRGYLGAVSESSVSCEAVPRQGHHKVASILLYGLVSVNSLFSILKKWGRDGSVPCLS